MTDETHLSEELHRRAADLPSAHLTFDDVRSRARRIRRRRAATTVAALAVVAAVVVPAALLSGGGSGGDGAPPVSTPSRAVDPQTDPLPTLQDGVIIGPDVRVPLPLAAGERADGFAPLGASRYVVTLQTGDGGRRVMLLDEQGRQQGSWPLDGGLAAASAATAVAWLSPDGTPQLLRAGSNTVEPLSNGIEHGTSIAAVTGDCGTQAGLCNLWIRFPGSSGEGSTQVVSTAGNGSSVGTRAAVPYVEDAVVGGALVAGLDTVGDDPDHTCGGVYDAAESTYLWRQCGINVLDLSPNGALVATTYGEGLGPTGVVVRDAHSGNPITTYSTDGWISGFAWQDDEHLLAVEVGQDGSTVLRQISAHANRVVLAGFHTGADEAPPIVLPVVG